MKLTRPVFNQSEMQYLKECLDSEWVTQGPFTQRFENEVIKSHSLTNGYAVTSCTAGLHIAAHALQLNHEDEVIVPAFTWITSANTAEYVGAKVRFADVDPVTFNLDPESVKAAITDKTKAIVAVHLFGLAAPMDELLEIAKQHDLYIIEDAACALGTTYKGKAIGEIGDISSFSFHPRKAITTGEGGLVATANEELAYRVRALRNHGAVGPNIPVGEKPQPWTMARFEILGFNYRMSDIQAAVGLAQMEKFPEILRLRKEKAANYDRLLGSMGDLITPSDPHKEHKDHSYQSYVLRVADQQEATRNSLMKALQKEGIESRPGTHAVHCLKYYTDKYNLKPMDFPNAVLCENSSITIPLFASMTDDDQERVSSILKHFFQGA